MITPAAHKTASKSNPGMGFAAFVALIALMMAINAMSMDIMLPALPAIGDALGVTEDNQRQWIVIAYLIGMGPMQLVYGPMADRFGRKPVLITGLSIYCVCTLIAALAPTFTLLVAARALQGAGAAAIRVLAVTIVRDCFVGRTMARVMSLAFIVFLAAPMIAPTIGQGIVALGPWRWIFVVLFIYGLAITAWAALKLNETQHPKDRRDLSFSRVGEAFRIALTTRMAVGYMLAQTVVFGSLLGFVTSSQQIITDVLDSAKWFGLIFAAIALGMACAQILNARVVERLGTRRVSHTALIGFILISFAHVIIAATTPEGPVIFTVMQALSLFAFGLMGPNFGAMAMAPLGHIAGTGSAVQGFVSTTGAAVIGFAIGQQFNGSLIPLTVGSTLCGLVTLLIVMATEKGRLFQPSPAGEDD
jgi:DHA1 family bicyclomycin/chloramphenicol resistance-like MFS transporter